MTKGISREKIVAEAKQLIAENKTADFSMHTIAERLGVKTASLYTHVSGIGEVFSGASREILRDYHDAQMQSIKGRSRGEALLSLAQSERNYAREHPGYYELIMNLQLLGDDELRDAASSIMEPIMTILNQYRLSEEQKTNAERAFRALVFGFISQEQHGYFTHFKENTDESFRFAVEMMIDRIGAMENAKQGRTENLI